MGNNGKRRAGVGTIMVERKGNWLEFLNFSFRADQGLGFNELPNFDPSRSCKSLLSKSSRRFHHIGTINHHDIQRNYLNSKDVANIVKCVQQSCNPNGNCLNPEILNLRPDQGRGFNEFPNSEAPQGTVLQRLIFQDFYTLYPTH